MFAECEIRGNASREPRVATANVRCNIPRYPLSVIRETAETHSRSALPSRGIFFLGVASPRIHTYTCRRSLSLGLSESRNGTSVNVTIRRIPDRLRRITYLYLERSTNLPHGSARRVRNAIRVALCRRTRDPVDST